MEEIMETNHQYVPRLLAKVSQPTAPVQRKHKQAYITMAKIHNNKVVLNIYNHMIEIPITVTLWELLSLVPELHTQVADTTVKCCIP
jgi:hypothetical protein